MKKTTIVVMIVTIIAKLFGFLRDTIIGKFFFGPESDAFMLAYSIPTMIFTVVAAALVTGFIPMYTRIRNESKKETNAFVNNVFNIMVLISFIVGVVVMLIPEVFVKAFAYGFDDGTVKIAIPMVRILSVSVVAVAIVQLGTGYLNVNKSFILPNLLPIPSNLIIVACALFAYKNHRTDFLAVGALLGFALQGFLMYLFMRKYGFKYRLHIDFNDTNLRMMILLAVPLLLSTLVSTVSDAAMKSYATYIGGEGAYSYVTMANRLLGFASSLFVTGTLSVAYPTIADAASKNHTGRVIKSMNDAILLISLFILPATVGFLTMNHEIVDFVYRGQKIGDKELLVLKDVFAGYAVGLFFLAIRDLYTRLHYAYHDMRTPLVSTVIYSITNLFFCVLLGRFLKLPGLTLASSIAGLISSIHLFVNIKRRFKKLYLRVILLDMIKIIFSCIVMAVAIMTLKPIIFAKSSLRIGLMIIIVLAVVLYAVLLLLLRVDVVLSLLRRKAKTPESVG